MAGARKEDLYELLSDSDAQRSHLNTVAYRLAVDELFEGTDEERQEVVVSLVWERTDEKQLAGMAILKEKAIDLTKLSSFSTALPLPRLEPRTNRYRYFEVSYVVRKSDFRGQAIGPVSIGTGMEHVYLNARRYCVSYWLQVGCYNDQ